MVEQEAESRHFGSSKANRESSAHTVVVHHPFSPGGLSSRTIVFHLFSPKQNYYVFKSSSCHYTKGLHSC